MKSFKHFDASGDGEIDGSELKGMVRDMGRTDLTDEQIEKLFETYDANKDGKIDFTEYLQMCVELSEAKKSFGRQDTGNEESVKMEG